MSTAPAGPLQSGLAAGEGLWRQRVGALQRVPQLLRDLRVDPRPMLAAAGLNESAFDLPGNTIPCAAFGRFIHVGAQHTGLAHFGLLRGGTWTLQSLGLRASW